MSQDTPPFGGPTPPEPDTLAQLMPAEEPSAAAAPPSLRDLDPANRSLVEALRLSFVIVKIVFAALIVYYLSTGWNTVSEQSYGLRLAFGKMRDTSALEPGGYGSWPYPIGEFIQVPKAVQAIELNEEFWLHLDEGERGKAFEELSDSGVTGLIPGLDGSVLTADANIAHTQWRVAFVVRDPRRYIENISEPDAEKIVRKAVERGVVWASALHSLDEVVSSPDLLSADVRRSAQEMLDQIESGISIETVICNSAKPPVFVYPDYQSVNQASSDANKAVEQARAKATTALNSVAGPLHRTILELIDRYEEALAAEPAIAPRDNAQAEAILKQVEEAMGSASAAGEVVEIIGRAQRERAAVVQEAKAEAQVFEAWVGNYEENPALTVYTLWANALRDIRDNEFERFFVGPDTDLVQIDWNRDPLIERRLKTLANQQDLESRNGNP